MSLTGNLNVLLIPSCVLVSNNVGRVEKSFSQVNKVQMCPDSTDYDLLPRSFITPHSYIQLLSFHLLDFDESHAVKCALRSESECLIAFTLVVGENGSTVYKLRLGKSPFVSLTHPIITRTISIWQGL